MKPVSPYRNVEQYTRILLEPYQMNSDIRNSLKLNLKKKVEKRCNKNGYVDEVYKILSLKDGVMPPENLSGSSIYDIKYHCRLCLPIENSIIISQVKMVNQELIVTNNGPIITFIGRENVDTNIWDITENYQHKEQKNVKLNVGDFVLIQILQKRISKGDTQIKTIGKLLDLASEQQVKNYFDSIIDIMENPPNELLSPSNKKDQKLKKEETSINSSETNFII
jgi:DNA-directed RNA polymerase subunit E'/Rpb7